MYCGDLISITMLPPTPPTIGSNIFWSTPSLKTVYVADEEARTLYQAESPWNAYEIVVMATGIENMEMGKNATGIAGYYDMNGRRITGKQCGPVIVRYSDGSMRKVILK